MRLARRAQIFTNGSQHLRHGPSAKTAGSRSFEGRQTTQQESSRPRVLLRPRVWASADAPSRGSGVVGAVRAPLAAAALLKGVDWLDSGAHPALVGFLVCISEVLTSLLQSQ